MNRCFNLVSLIALSVLQIDTISGCARDKSRIIRDEVDHNIRRIFKSVKQEMPRSCPFYWQRDMYHLHESHKTEESYGKWYCDYCGKGFYAETLLDHHLQNKHADKLYMAPDSVCLSDYCDIFRCDIVSQRVIPTFWDSALCIEDDMTDMVEKCDNVFSKCIPRGLSLNESDILLGKLKTLICDNLTCNRYWFTGNIDESQWKMLLKTFLTVLLISAMIVYYFLFYHHFYAESLYERPPPKYFTPYNPQPPQSHYMVRRRRRHRKTVDTG